jgi:hypothetical protein
MVTALISTVSSFNNIKFGVATIAISCIIFACGGLLTGVVIAASGCRNEIEDLARRLRECNQRADTSAPSVQKKYQWDR